MNTQTVGRILHAVTTIGTVKGTLRTGLFVGTALSASTDCRRRVPRTPSGRRA